MLKVFFHALKIELSNTVRSSTIRAIGLTEIFWQKARNPIRKNQKNIEKLEGIYHNWVKIMKNATRKTEAQIEREKSFEESLDDVFDNA